MNGISGIKTRDEKVKKVEKEMEKIKEQWIEEERGENG